MLSLSDTFVTHRLTVGPELGWGVSCESNPSDSPEPYTAHSPENHLSCCQDQLQLITLGLQRGGSVEASPVSSCCYPVLVDHASCSGIHLER